MTTMPTTTKAQAIADEFRTWCEKLDFTYSVNGAIVKLTRRFTPQSLDEFTSCDVDYPSLTCILPYTGSVWGTEGGGCGAMQALRTGVFIINVSGVRSTVCKELTK